jgi:hypothetical protein
MVPLSLLLGARPCCHSESKAGESTRSVVARGPHASDGRFEQAPLCHMQIAFFERFWRRELEVQEPLALAPILPE